MSKILAFLILTLNLQLLSLEEIDLSLKIKTKEQQIYAKCGSRETIENRASQGYSDAFKTLACLDLSEDKACNYMVMHFIRELQDSYCYDDNTQINNILGFELMWQSLGNFIADNNNNKLAFDEIKRISKQIEKIVPENSYFSKNIKKKLKPKDEWIFIRQSVLDYIINNFSNHKVHTQNMSTLYTIHHPQILRLISNKETDKTDEKTTFSSEFCNNCKKPQTEGLKFKACNGSCSQKSKTYYCSIICQKTDWQLHKLICKKSKVKDVL